jgi:hypothetical protein
LNHSFLKLSALCAALFLAGCQSTGSMTAPNPNEPMPPSNPAFQGEMAKFNAQFPNAKATRYEDESLKFNDANKLDMKGNCHDMSIHPVTIILVLDANGRVTSSTTDVDNKKAACFRNAYAGVSFPKPPSAPYYKPLRLK